MDRRKEYMRRYQNASMEQKIRCIKAIETHGSMYENRGMSMTIDSIGNVLTEVCGDNWDIIISQPTEKKFHFEVVIHFPETTITNSKGMSHVIKDLYVRLLPTRTTSGMGFQSFEGKRMSATVEEIISCYKHSHLPSQNYSIRVDRHSFSFQNFCLGTSEINQVLSMISSDYSEGRFKLFLMQLYEFVNWESLEGTPHISISNVIGGGKAGTINSIECKHYYDELKKGIINETYPKKEIDFKLENNNVVVVDNEKLEHFIKKGEIVSLYSSNHICEKDDKGQYYKYKQRITVESLSGDSLYAPDEKVGFYFRGELVVFKLIKTEEEEEDKPFFIHKSIKEYVKQELEQKIKKRRVANHIVKQLNSTTYLKRDTR